MNIPTLDVSRLRAILAEERDRIRTRFLADRQSETMLESYSTTLDKIIHGICIKYLSEKDISVFALGGYGRRELYPASDIDLLFVYPSARPEAVPGITTALQILWDLDLTIGNQVWTWEEIRALNLENEEFVFALVDARPIIGEERATSELLSGFLPGFLSKHSDHLVELLVSWTDQRHAPYWRTIYQLEPDLKQSPGGLRDFQVGRWAGRLRPSDSFRPFTEGEIERAHDFLARLRILLHYLTGRNQNQLTHRLQEQVCRHLGYKRAAERSGVESLMKEYFLHARVIFSFCQAALRKRGRSRRESDFESVGAVRSFSEILDLCLEALETGRSLGDSFSEAVVQALPAIQGTLSYPALQTKLLKVFKPREGLYHVLSRLYELGILEVLFPEFGSIRARVIRDFYHRYTVDEHTLQAIRAIEDLTEPKGDADPRFASLLREAQSPEMVTLTLLLHDVGKSRGGKHVDSGARMAAKALRRYRFEKNFIDTIVFLIRNHLAMSAVIFRRNLEDPDVVKRFSDLVEDTERLRLLCLITYGDIKGVAPDTLNEWKRDRLWQLYVATYNKLTLGFGQERIEEEDIGERLLTRLPSNLDAEGFEAFLEGFPLRYLTTTPPDEIYAHYRLRRKFSADRPAQIKITSRATHHDLYVVTKDTLHLFSKIVGLLSYFDMNILRGYGFANRQNIILDFFQFIDTREVFKLNPVEKAHFRDLLMKAVEDKVSIDRLLRSKEESVVFKSVTPRFSPVISFDEEQSRDYTIMEIVAPDSIGLLYRISHEISLLGCNIELVLISTEGDRAVDVFYLTQRGDKLNAEIREVLSKKILQAVG